MYSPADRLPLVLEAGDETVAAVAVAAADGDGDETKMTVAEAEAVPPPPEYCFHAVCWRGVTKTINVMCTSNGECLHCCGGGGERIRDCSILSLIIS